MKNKDTLIILSAIAIMMVLGILRSVRENSKNTEIFTVTKVETEFDNSSSIQTTEKYIASNSKSISSTAAKTKAIQKQLSLQKIIC